MVLMPIQAMMLASDSDTTQDEITPFSPREVTDAKGDAGWFGVYRRRQGASFFDLPAETETDEYFEFHERMAPMENEVTKCTAFGSHWGVTYCFGSKPCCIRDLLKHREALDFYV